MALNNLQIATYTGAINSQIMDLLLLADPNQKLVQDYIATGDILLAHCCGQLAAVAVLIEQPEFELKNIAVDPEYQGRGIAKQLIHQVCAMAAARGAESLMVATGNSSLAQLALYQKCGFRMAEVRANFFAEYPEQIMENGIPCVDLVVLRRFLDPV